MKNKIYPLILSPEGITHSITHLSNFAKEHSLDPSALSRVLSGKAKSHKGWKLASMENNNNQG